MTNSSASHAHDADWVTGQPCTIWSLIGAGEPVTFLLPGCTAVRIDPAARVLAVDGRSSFPEDEGTATRPAWTVADLRDGTYGGFHRLKPAAECFDAECAARGEHDRRPAPGAAGPVLAPSGYFATISFFGRIEHAGYVTEVTGHGGIAAYHIDLPDKVWGGNPLAEVEYAASAWFGKQLLSEDSVRQAWQADQDRAERVRRQQDEWNRRAAGRALAAGSDEAAHPSAPGHSRSCQDPWCPGDCAATPAAVADPESWQEGHPEDRKEGHMTDETTTTEGAQEGAEDQAGEQAGDTADTA